MACGGWAVVYIAVSYLWLPPNKNIPDPRGAQRTRPKAQRTWRGLYGSFSITLGLHNKESNERILVPNPMGVPKNIA